MNSPLSCRRLFKLPRVARNLAFHAAVLSRQSGLDTRRGSVAINDQAYVARTQAELSRDAGLNIPGELCSVRACVHIHSKATENCLERSKYSRGLTMSIEKTSAAINIFKGESLAQKIKALRKSCQLKQKDLAALCGVTQTSVSQWESEREEKVAIPTAKALMKLSELAPEADRQWWRDQAAEEAGLDAIDDMYPVSHPFPRAFRTIPLIQNTEKVGTLGTLALADIEQNLFFPSECFPSGGAIQATRIEGKSASDMIAMIDISRRDAAGLVGDMVAVRTVTGVEVRWLGHEENTFLLLPFRPGQTLRLLRHDGEGSIIGRVCWVGNAIAPPPPPPEFGAKKTKQLCN